MGPNVFTSLIAGVAMLGGGVGSVWGLLYAIEYLLKVIDKGVLLYLMMTPLVLFASYLVGHGYLDNRKRVRSR